MIFTLIVTLYEFLMAKWFAYVMTVHEDQKNKAIVNEAMERANAIDRQNAEQRVRLARMTENIDLVIWTLRQPEFSDLLNKSETVKTLWTRVVMLENCVHQHEIRVKELETENAKPFFVCAILWLCNCAQMLYLTSR